MKAFISVNRASPLHVIVSLLSLLFIRPAQAGDVVDVLDLQDRWKEIFSRVGKGGGVGGGYWLLDRRYRHIDNECMFSSIFINVGDVSLLNVTIQQSFEGPNLLL